MKWSAIPPARAIDYPSPELPSMASQHARNFVVASFLLLAGSAHAWAQGKIEYNRDVRPILAENCFACHGPDSASRKAKLRLDQRDDAIKAGAIAPGKLAESALIARILASDPAEIMPPPKSHQKLTA